MTRKAILRFVLVLIIGLLLIAIVGILHNDKQKREPVWATGEQAIEWSKEKLPLGVWLDAELRDDYYKSLDVSIKSINSAVGCTLLVVSNKESARVWILFETCEDKSHAGCAYFSPVDGRGIIKTGRPGDITQAHVMFSHELGHILGLAHDGLADRESKAVMVSAMADNAPELADRTVRLTTKDAEALHGRYCE